MRPPYIAFSFQLSINLAFCNRFIEALSNTGILLDSLLNEGGEELVLGKMSLSPLSVHEPPNDEPKRLLRGYDAKRPRERKSISNPYHVNESPMEDSIRYLQEYDPTSDPEDNPLSIQFHGYQDSSIQIHQWMVDVLRGLYDTRLGQGVSKPLCFNEFLMIAAQKHIDDIVEHNLTLSHIGSDNSTGIERIMSEGYQYESYGATITKTQCTDVLCALINRPLFFSNQGKFQHLGIAREENQTEDDPQWYWIFAESDVDLCMGMNITALEWPAGTPTLPPEPPEPELPHVDPHGGIDLIEDWMISLLSLMNAERMQEDVHNLCFNRKLTSAAQMHNQDMVDNDFFNHTGSNGTSPSIRVTALGYDDFDFLSENIAKVDNPSIGAVMYTWMSSPGIHLSNIVDANADHVGMAFDEATGKYTVVFGGYTTDDEKCISGIICENTESHMTLDEEWDLHTSCLCLRQKPVSQIGVMGSGFGMDWYFNNSLETYLRRM